MCIAGSGFGQSRACVAFEICLHKDGASASLETTAAVGVTNRPCRPRRNLAVNRALVCVTCLRKGKSRARVAVVLHVNNDRPAFFRCAASTFRVACRVGTPVRHLAMNSTLVHVAQFDVSKVRASDSVEHGSLEQTPRSCHGATIAFGIASRPLGETTYKAVDWAVLHVAGLCFNECRAFVASMGIFLGDTP